MNPLYGQIFHESIRNAFVLPLGSEPTLFAMRSFGGYDMTVPFALAIVGSILGQAANYIVGDLLSRTPYHPEKFTSTHFAQAKTVFNQAGFVVVSVCWLPYFGPLFTVMAGLFRARLTYVIPLICAGELFNYLRYLF